MRSLQYTAQLCAKSDIYIPTMALCKRWQFISPPIEVGEFLLILVKNYAVNLSFMVIEKNGKLPDTKAAQDTMLDLIFPFCETKDRQCMG